jgi:DNA-binding NarL/FixJ family response regulator
MNQARRIRVLFVDDHPIVRAGLREAEKLAPDICVVGEAATVEEALALIPAQRPDVVVLDLRLPDGDGLDVCRRTKASFPQTQVLCLTAFADERLVLAAMQAGADGYLLKHNDAQHIVDAVRAVMAGNPVFDPALAAIGASSGQANAGTPGALGQLSAGERRVLAAVAKGLTDKEVATVLNLSVKTVRNSLDRVFAKLGVHTRTQAAMLFAASDRSV